MLPTAILVNMLAILTEDRKKIPSRSLVGIDQPDQGLYAVTVYILESATLFCMFIFLNALICR
jgi:hypothetical protein